MKATKKSNKSSQWEKIRRDKLNESFSSLNKLLPNYDPSVTVSKSEILHKAALYIQELQEKVKTMGVKEGFQKTMRIEVKTSYERIKKLIQRNEQLCLFIRDAGIKLPKHYGNTKNFKRPLCWTNKITEAQAEDLSKRELESQKENQEGVNKKKRNRIRNGEKKSLGQKRIKIFVEGRKTRSSIKSVRLPNTQTTLGNVVSQSCVLISNSIGADLTKTGGTNKSAAITVVTSSPSSSTPKVSSIISPPTTRSNPITNLNTLGPGTLILANGNVVRILPQPPPIIIKPPTNNLVILTTTTSIYTKSFTTIRPKLKAVTKTTQMNKVPIPTLIQHSIPKRKARGTKRKLQKLPSAKECTEPEKTDKVITQSFESEKDLNKENVETEKLVENKSTELPPESNQANDLLESASEITDSAKVLDDIVESVKVSEITEVVLTKSQVSNGPEIEVAPLIVEDKNKPSVDHLELGMNLNSELSNDIFSSLQVPIGGQNPESTSPTAAFLLAFPLVSSLTGVKVAEVIEEENSSSHNGTPTLLQIGTMDTTKTTQSESLTPNLLNLDNFSFFSGYSSFDYSNMTTTTTTITTVQKAPVTLSKTFSGASVVKTNFSCIQDITSVTYSKVGSVSTPYVQCENQNLQPQEQKHIINDPKPYVTTTVQCNTFNTYADFSKVPNTYPSNFTKSYTEPLYTNSSTHYNYNQNHYNSNQYYLSKPATTTNYQRYNYYNNTAKTTQAKEKCLPLPKNKNQPKPPINWMTTPDFRGSTSEYAVPPVPSFSKDIEYNPSMYPPVVSTHTNYFNNTNSHEFQQNTQFEENQFSWSPSKLPQYLEAPHGYVATTLPTLVGDLALGTTNQPNLEQNVPKPKDRNKHRVNPGNYDTNSGNFLSISQLVEHKTDRTANRRNPRNLKTTQKIKKLPEAPKDLVDDKKPVYPNWMDGCNNKLIRHHGNKNTQSNYSAEALIGHQDLDNSANRQRYRQNFTTTVPNKTLPIPTYLSDNIVPPYFPPVEITQENFIQSNQNYQNFTQNTSSYLPDFSTTHDYANSNRPNNDCSLKKPKHKPTNENLSMDFGFLSMPSSINSPILPDDFHAHANFLSTPTPNQLYPCKNPLYPKQSSDLLSLPPVPGSRNTTQQYENMPGVSLTNFNLSAIFPEINKGSGMYSSEPARNKNYNFHYLGSTVQTTFYNKSTAATSSYINTSATTFAPTN